MVPFGFHMMAQWSFDQLQIATKVQIATPLVARP
jgi:hypothetical protein